MAYMSMRHLSSMLVPAVIAAAVIIGITVAYQQKNTSPVGPSDGIIRPTPPPSISEQPGADLYNGGSPVIVGVVTEHVEGGLILEATLQPEGIEGVVTRQIEVRTTRSLPLQTTVRVEFTDPSDLQQGIINATRVEPQ